MATKFLVGDFVRFVKGAALANGRYPITEFSEWNANSPMLVVKAEEIAGAPDQFTLKRESTLIGRFPGPMLVKVDPPVANTPPPMVPDAIGG